MGGFDVISSKMLNKFCRLYSISVTIICCSLCFNHHVNSFTNLSTRRHAFNHQRIPTTTTTTRIGFIPTHDMLSTTSNRKRISTDLKMVVTKSGGRSIQSVEQFQSQVLNITDINNNESDSKSKRSNNQGRNVSFINQDKPVLVYYSAPWCGPCRLSNPVVKDIIRLFVPTIDVIEVCTDDLPEIAENAGVVSIPTIQLYYNGEIKDTIVGCVAKNVLASAVNKLLEDVGLDNGKQES